MALREPLSQRDGAAITRTPGGAAVTAAAAAPRPACAEARPHPVLGVLPASKAGLQAAWPTGRAQRACAWRAQTGLELAAAAAPAAPRTLFACCSRLHALWSATHVAAQCWQAAAPWVALVAVDPCRHRRRQRSSGEAAWGFVGEVAEGVQPGCRAVPACRRVEGSLHIASSICAGQ